MSKLVTADALIIVDMQRGFLRKQPDLVERVAALVNSYPPESTLWLIYRNYPNSPFVRNLGWGEFMSAPDTDIVEPFHPDPARVFQHLSYSLPEEMVPHLASCRTVALAGTDTDACIQACAFDLWDRGIQPLIVSPCCGSSGGPHFHNAALDIMRRQFGTQAIVHSIMPAPRPDGTARLSQENLRNQP